MNAWIVTRPGKYAVEVHRTYDIVVVNRAGMRRVHRYTTDEELPPGDVLRLEGRYWLVSGPATEGGPDRLIATPARYRLRLTYPDGREELGAFRRFRPGSPRIGHAFTAIEDGQPASWQVVDELLVLDEQGEGYLELVAARDYSEVEDLPDHELEHALARADENLPEAAQTTFDRAEAAGLAVELVALEPGEAADWEEAERFLDALVLEELEDDLLEQCGVDPDRHPRETWLERVKERLRSDLERFRADIDGEHDQIEEWEFLDGRIFASVGSADDEADPGAGHGWMCRLVDSSVLAAAGFARVRKAELLV
jgi:hypothetical protein